MELLASACAFLAHGGLRGMAQSWHNCACATLSMPVIYHLSLKLKTLGLQHLLSFYPEGSQSSTNNSEDDEQRKFVELIHFKIRLLCIKVTKNEHSGRISAPTTNYCLKKFINLKGKKKS